MKAMISSWLLVIVSGLSTAFFPLPTLAGPGDLYESDRGTNTIFRFTAGGTKTTFASGLNAPMGLAFDTLGNLYEADNGSNTIFKFTSAGTKTAFATGLNAPTALAIDSQGNVFEADFGSGTILKFTPAGTKSTFASGFSEPMGLAFDSAGNLYASDTTGNTISKFTPAGIKSTFASGLNGPIGLAFDAGGILYDAEYGPDTVFKITPDGARSIFVAGLNYPLSLAVSSSDAVFLGDFGSGNIYKLAAGSKTVFAAADQPEGLAFEPPIEFKVLATVPLPATATAAVAVNQALNKIYASGGTSASQDVVVIDGTNFASTDLGPGSGSGANVDLKTDRYWAGTVSNGSVIVRDGATNSILATVALGNCPINTSYDFKKNRIWVGAQCGGGNDPLFVIDANTFQTLTNPIGSGGVMGNIIANGNNGRVYLTAGGVSKRVNPNSFAVTSNAFGAVMAINTAANKLYAVSGTNLQIVNGTPDPELVASTISLPYAPASMGINIPLNHLYVTNPAGSSVEVRNGTTGALVAAFSLSSFGFVPNGAIAVDSTRGRIYVVASGSSGSVLLVIEDLTSARNVSANLGS